MVIEGIAPGEVLQIVEESQASGIVGISEPLQEPPTEPLRQHAHREEEVWPTGEPTLAVEGDATCGNDAVEVRVVTSVTLIDWATMEDYEGRMKERRSQVLAQLSDAELMARVAQDKAERAG